MSPRPYNAPARRAAGEHTRARVITAARELLASRTGLARFTVDAVARRAGVARMTVYYQFKSKRRLLDSLYDELARRGGIDQLPRAFQNPDPAAALSTYVELFGRFWSRDRLVMRRIRALAILDSEVEAGIRERDAWRAAGLNVLVSRLRPDLTDEVRAGVVNILQMLLGFSSFDALAGDSHSPEDVVPMVQRLTRQVIDLA